MAHISADLSKASDGDVQILGSDGTSLASVSASGALKVDGSAVTQPVSGTVTANQGTANTTANAWPTKVTDGTNTASVKAASTAPVASDPALVVTISPNSPTQTVTISGASTTRSESSNAAIAGTAFSYINNSLVVNTAQTNLLLISNSGVNTKSMIIASSFIAAGVGTSNWVNVSYFSSPTVTTNGTAATARNRRLGNATTSVISLFTGPTISANGTLVEFRPNGSNNTGAVFDFYRFDPYLIVPPGQTLLISATAKANSVPVDINLQWFEAVV